MKNEIQIFNNPDFGEIRTVLIDNKPYFVGNDVAKALGYSYPKDAIARHCKGATVHRPLGQQEFKIIPEGDVYRLIIKASSQSNSEEIREKAEKFEEWIFDELLPSIRSKGTYGQPKSPMELLELHYQAIKQVNSRVDDLQTEFEQFKQDMPILGEDCSHINATVKEKVIECAGGKSSNAYNDRAIQKRLFRDIYAQCNRQLGIHTYKALKRSQIDEYVAAIHGYEPPKALQASIDEANAQLNMRI